MQLIMRNNFLIILIIILLTVFTDTAHAQISVDNVIVHFPAEARPVHNVIVGNSSPHTAYVIVEVESVPDPANDIGKSVASTELLASPKAFSIEPNGQRTVRLLLKTPPNDKERVFRVGFIPQDRGFGQKIEHSEAGRSAVIRVLTGMGILVFADPKNPQAQLKWERDDKNVTFSNLGSIHVYLGDIKSCNKANECTNISPKRLYAGSTYQIAAPGTNTVSFMKKEGASGSHQKLTIDPKG